MKKFIYLLMLGVMLLGCGDQLVHPLIINNKEIEDLKRDLCSFDIWAVGDPINYVYFVAPCSLYNVGDTLR